MSADLAERFWAKVAHADIGCWEWTASRGSHGYGQIGRDGMVTTAHRISYELHYGPIPQGMQIDHLCSNRGCVRPDHLEVVTQQENLRRGSRGGFAAANAAKTLCLRGHPFDGKNDGRRTCSVCRRETNRRWQRLNR